MKIKNLKRFITFITVMLFIAISISLFISNSSFSHSDNIKKKTIYTSYGDTLWTIAETEQKNNEYYKNKNIREIIEDIKSINNMKTSNLASSQELLIPYIN